MSTILPDHSAAAITQAIEANLWAYWRLFGRLPRAELHDAPDLRWVLTDIPLPLFNGVIHTDREPAAVDATITTLLQRCTARRVPLLWVVGPTTRPPDLGHALNAHGFRHVGDDPGMALDLATLVDPLPQPTGLVIERVNDPTALHTWCSFTDQSALSQALFALFSAIGFGPEAPIHNYLGRLDGQPVATASLVLGAGVAGIYNVMTVPEAQGQGIGTLMTVTPLRAAQAQGYRVGVLQSSRQGLGLYRRLGFREYCTLGLYLWPGPEGSSEAGPQPV